MDKPETIKQVLMRRDGLSADEADEMVAYAKERIADGEDPEEVCYEEFGLEPDYVFELLGW
ncbi:MAG: hypothetical protein IPO35_16980 [Uliginosibacterium sp.]|nr:hypothetical protein [Uliginosibacterium sp.]